MLAQRFVSSENRGASMKTKEKKSRIKIASLKKSILI